MDEALRSHKRRKNRPNANWFVLDSSEGVVSYLGEDNVHLGEENVFVSWSFDGRNFEFRNDRYGMYPFFYANQTGRLICSDRIEFLVWMLDKRDFDWEAISAFLYLGYYLADTTPYRDIKVMPPDSRICAEGLRVEGCWPTQTVFCKPREQCLVEYGERFHETMKYATERFNPYQVLLSGGRDSRHIFLEAVSGKKPPVRCVTTSWFAPDPCSDPLAARALCKIYGVPHLMVREPWSRFLAEYRKNVATQFLADEHAWLTALPRKARHAEIPFFFDGIGGDVLSAGLGQSQAVHDMYLSRRYDRLIDHYLRPPIHPEFFRRVGVPELADSREQAEARLRLELSRCADALNPALAFWFWNRTRREISLSPFGVLRGLGVGVCPYLSPEVFDFLYGLPAELVLDTRFHTQAINERHPRNAKDGIHIRSRVPVGVRRLHGVYHRLHMILGTVLLPLVSGGSDASIGRFMAEAVRARFEGRASQTTRERRPHTHEYLYLQMLLRR